MDSACVPADGLDPARVIHVREPSIGLDAVPVIDHVAAGRSIGGLRSALRLRPVLK